MRSPGPEAAFASSNRRTSFSLGQFFGLLWGIAALVNTSLLAFLPVSGLWIWWRRWKPGKRSLGGIALASVIFLACIAPWTVRNYRTFGKLFLIRRNFGAELRLGNGPGANGTWMQTLHPTQNAHEMNRYRGMGEIDYIEVRKEEAYAFIREDMEDSFSFAGNDLSTTGLASLARPRLSGRQYLEILFIARLLYWLFGD